MAKKQGELPGVEDQSIPEIEEAAEAYVSLRDKRMQTLTKEIEAKSNLMTAMLAHEKELPKGPEGERVYRFGDEMVLLKTGKNIVKVKHVIDPDDEDED